MIKLLPKEIASKIAAGEVIERPVSVVKELFENALDAQATHISIHLEDGGKSLIEIVDNGKGIALDDLYTIGQRHATSKVSTLQDLSRILTLGFRGEALASMCAMSTVEIESKRHDDTQANKVVICGQKRTITQQIAHKTGTTIRVKDLFSEFPARKKFLKTAQTELALITNCIIDYVLGFPQIHINITHNAKQLAVYPATQTTQERFGQVYGISIAKQLKQIPLGFISSPSHTKSDKSGIHLFINSRAVKNTALIQAVCAGYGHHLMTKRYPYACIWLTVHPQDVDVNVHPAKLIVKVVNEQDIAQIITQQISAVVSHTSIAQAQDTLDTHTTQNIQQTTTPIVANTHIQLVTQTSSSSDKSDKNIHQNVVIAKSPTTVYATQSTSMNQKQSQPSLNNDTPEKFKSHTITHNNSTSDSVTQQTPVSIVQKSQQQTFTHTPTQIEFADQTVTYIGQIHKTYAICESKKGMVLVDFHAAHERYNYEQFKKLYEQQAVTVQTLLSPVSFTVTPAQATAIELHAQVLQTLGFDIRLIGQQQALVTSVPWLLHKIQHTQLLVDIIDTISSVADISKQSQMATQVIADKIDAIITKMACIASDKAGDELSDERMKELLRFVSKAQYAYQCPHGRPTMIEITTSQLEKMFGRK
jgi:DNA mismatch repair protein MutL